MKETAPEECANCGAEIPRGARSCPECGADERTGWRETSIYDGLDLPDPERDPNEKPTQPGLALGWKIAGVGLIVLIVVLAVRAW
ncbi:MAG TPA: zinc ribbon domain-containing protein [Lacunisphaera sp.]